MMSDNSLAKHEEDARRQIKKTKPDRRRRKNLEVIDRLRRADKIVMLMATFSRERDKHPEGPIVWTREHWADLGCVMEDALLYEADTKED